MAFGTLMAGLGAGLFGSLVNQEMDEEMMAMQNYYNQENWKMQLSEGPSRMIEGYRKAGINPLLALGHSADSISPVGSQQAAHLDLAGIVNQAKQLDMQEQSMKMDNKVKAAQIDNIKADTENKEAGTGLTKSQTDNYNLLNKLMPAESKAKIDKMAGELSVLQKQADSLQLDNSVKQELAKGNEYWKNKLGDGVAYNTLYQLGHGNIADGARVVLAGIGKTIKASGDVVAKFLGLNKFKSVGQALESIIQKDVINKKGEVIGRTITHIQKG